MILVVLFCLLLDYLFCNWDQYGYQFDIRSADQVLFKTTKNNSSVRSGKIFSSANFKLISLATFNNNVNIGIRFQFFSKF
jgi:hypothetical protein